MKELKEEYSKIIGTRMAKHDSGEIDYVSTDDKTLNYKQRTINKLVKVLRDVGHTKAQLADLLLDDRGIFREVAQIRLKEIENESNENNKKTLE